MNISNDKQFSLLESFYSRAMPDFLKAEEKDFWLAESDRRILDVSRICYRFWPLLVGLFKVFLGGDFVLEIASKISKNTPFANTLEDSIYSIFYNHISEINRGSIQSVFLYESATHGLFDFLELAPRGICKGIEANGSVWYLKSDIDLVSYVKTLMHYLGLNAPDKLIRDLEPPTHECYCLFYKNLEEKVFVRQIN